MSQPKMDTRPCRSAVIRHHGFTLLELMISITLTLMMMGAVISMFGTVSNAMSESRATMMMSEQLRRTAAALQQDLAGATATSLTPPLDPDRGKGYFEYIEGPIGPVAPVNQWFADSNSATSPYQPFVNGDTNPVTADTTIGDNDDILMFTTRSTGEPFQGKLYARNFMAVSSATDPTPPPPMATTIKSSVAEVAWFVRGRTLYRRVLLVMPNAPINDDKYSAQLTDVTQRCDYPLGFYAQNDLSVHATVNKDGLVVVVPNSLSDLTKRENRFAHCLATPTSYTNASSSANNGGVPLPPFQFDMFPFDARRWYQLGLPTLKECSSPSWPAGMCPDSYNSFNRATAPSASAQDLWSNNPNGNPSLGISPRFSNPAINMGMPGDGNRVIEDVVMTNVIGFDVKIWDPGAPIVAAGTTPPLSNIALLPGEPGYAVALAQINPANGMAPLAFGAFVDLNYMCRLGPRPNMLPLVPNYPYGQARPASWPQPWFHGPALIRLLANSRNNSQPLNYTAQPYAVHLMGQPPLASGLNPQYIPPRNINGALPPVVSSPGAAWYAAVYDTSCSHYNRGGMFGAFNGASTTAFSGRGMNGYDDLLTLWTYDGSGNWNVAGTLPPDGVVDDLDEQEYLPPYPYPVKAIQVKIRAFDPTSRAVREMTIVQDFVPQ